MCSRTQAGACSVHLGSLPRGRVQNVAATPRSPIRRAWLMLDTSGCSDLPTASQPCKLPGGVVAYLEICWGTGGDDDVLTPELASGPPVRVLRLMLLVE